MKRKIIALIAVLAVGGSVSVFAASTCSQTPAANVNSAAAVKAAAVYTSTKTANSAVQTALSKAPSAARKSVSPAAVNSKSCQGGNCKSNSACAANSCTMGAACSKSNCTALNNCSATAAQTGSKSAVAAANSSTCKAGTTCSNNSACRSGTPSCPTGTTCKTATGCGTVYVYGGSGCNYSDLLKNALNNACGKTGSGASCSSAKPAPTKSSAPSAPASSASFSAFQNQVVSLVNSERAKAGVRALTADAALMKTATLKSQDMVKNNYFSHTSPTYGSPFDLMNKYGISYRTAGENIAMGQTSPTQVMNAWMNSAGHRANILNGSYTKIGVGVAQNSSGQYYWTQHFIG